MRNARCNKQMRFVHYQGLKPSLHHKEDNTRSSLVEAILQWILPSCIAPCSVDLIVFFFEQGVVLDFDDDGG